LGAVQVGVFAPGTLNRGLFQIWESLHESFFDACPRNLLGLAPFGQHFDDPDEPTPLEYADQLIELFDEYGGGSLPRRLLEDYFARPGEGGSR